MDAQVYKRFMVYRLSDVAERRDERGELLRRGQRRVELVNGEKRRVRLRGSHICYSGVEYFRGSDCLLRLDQAIRAGEDYYRATSGKTRGAGWNACLMTAELVLQSTCVPLKTILLRRHRRPKSQLKKRVGAEQAARATAVRPEVNEVRVPRFQELDALIAAEKQKPRPSKYSLQIRELAANIQKRIAQFRDDHKNLDLDQSYKSWLGAFRSDFCRDAEWYAAQEPVYQARIENAERFLHPSEGRSSTEPPAQIAASVWDRMVADDMCTRKSDVARAVVNLARLYHAQKKYSEAKVHYERALGIYEASAIPDELRAVVLPWIKAAIADCQSRRKT